MAAPNTDQLKAEFEEMVAQFPGVIFNDIPEGYTFLEGDAGKKTYKNGKIIYDENFHDYYKDGDNEIPFSDFKLDQFLIQDEAEQEYEFKIRSLITEAINFAFGSGGKTGDIKKYSINTCVIFGHMISKKIWLGVEYDVNIESLIKIILGDSNFMGKLKALKSAQEEAAKPAVSGKPVGTKPPGTKAEAAKAAEAANPAVSEKAAVPVKSAAPKKVAAKQGKGKGKGKGK